MALEFAGSLVPADPTQATYSCNVTKDSASLPRVAITQLLEQEIATFELLEQMRGHVHHLIERLQDPNCDQRMETIILSSLNAIALLGQHPGLASGISSSSNPTGPSPDSWLGLVHSLCSGNEVSPLESSTSPSSSAATSPASSASILTSSGLSPINQRAEHGTRGKTMSTTVHQLSALARLCVSFQNKPPHQQQKQQAGPPQQAMASSMGNVAQGVADAINALAHGLEKAFYREAWHRLSPTVWYVSAILKLSATVLRGFISTLISHQKTTLGNSVLVTKRACPIKPKAQGSKSHADATAVEVLVSPGSNQTTALSGEAKRQQMLSTASERQFSLLFAMNHEAILNVTTELRFARAVELMAREVLGCLRSSTTTNDLPADLEVETNQTTSIHPVVYPAIQIASMRAKLNRGPHSLSCEFKESNAHLSPRDTLEVHHTSAQQHSHQVQFTLTAKVYVSALCELYDLDLNSLSEQLTPQERQCILDTALRQIEERQALCSCTSPYPLEPLSPVAFARDGWEVISRAEQVLLRQLREAEGLSEDDQVGVHGFPESDAIRLILAVSVLTRELVDASLRRQCVSLFSNWVSSVLLGLPLFGCSSDTLHPSRFFRTGINAFIAARARITFVIVAPMLVVLGTDFWSAVRSDVSAQYRALFSELSDLAQRDASPRGDWACKIIQSLWQLVNESLDFVICRSLFPKIAGTPRSAKTIHHRRSSLSTPMSIDLKAWNLEHLSIHYNLQDPITVENPTPNPDESVDFDASFVSTGPVGSEWDAESVASSSATSFVTASVTIAGTTGTAGPGAPPNSFHGLPWQFFCGVTQMMLAAADGLSQHIPSKYLPATIARLLLALTHEQSAIREAAEKALLHLATEMCHQQICLRSCCYSQASSDAVEKSPELCGLVNLLQLALFNLEKWIDAIKMKRSAGKEEAKEANIPSAHAFEGCLSLVQSVLRALGAIRDDANSIIVDIQRTASSAFLQLAMLHTASSVRIAASSLLSELLSLVNAKCSREVCLALGSKTVIELLRHGDLFNQGESYDTPLAQSYLWRRKEGILLDLESIGLWFESQLQKNDSKQQEDDSFVDDIDTFDEPDIPVPVASHHTSGEKGNVQTSASGLCNNEPHETQDATGRWKGMNSPEGFRNRRASLSISGLSVNVQDFALGLAAVSVPLSYRDLNRTHEQQRLDDTTSRNPTPVSKPALPESVAVDEQTEQRPGTPKGTPNQLAIPKELDLMDSTASLPFVAEKLSTPSRAAASARTRRASMSNLGVLLSPRTSGLSGDDFERSGRLPGSPLSSRSGQLHGTPLRGGGNPDQSEHQSNFEVRVDGVRDSADDWSQATLNPSPRNIPPIRRFRSDNQVGICDACQTEITPRGRPESGDTAPKPLDSHLLGLDQLQPDDLAQCVVQLEQFDRCQSDNSATELLTPLTTVSQAAIAIAEVGTNDPRFEVRRMASQVLAVWKRILVHACGSEEGLQEAAQATPLSNG